MHAEGTYCSDHTVLNRKYEQVRVTYMSESSVCNYKKKGKLVNIARSCSYFAALMSVYINFMECIARIPKVVNITSYTLGEYRYQFFL